MCTYLWERDGKEVGVFYYLLMAMVHVFHCSAAMCMWIDPGFFLFIALSLSPFVGLPFLRCHKWKRARAKAESISVHCARPYQITTEKYKSVSELCLIHIDSEVIYFAKLELRYEKLACAAAAAAVAVAVAVRFEDTHITLRIDLAYKIWTVLVLAETHKCSRRRNLSLAISQQWNLYLQMWIVYLILLLLLFYYYCCI